MSCCRLSVGIPCMQYAWFAQVHVQMDGWMDGWTEGWMDGGREGGRDEWIGRDMYMDRTGT